MKKFAVLLNGRAAQVGIAPLDDHRFTVVIDDVPFDVDVRSAGPDSLSLLMENRSIDLSYFFRGDQMELHFGDQCFQLEILNERRKGTRQSRTSGESSGPEIIKAFMPGKIVQVGVRPGDRVAPGASVLIIEAMKMENEIFCRCGGVVRAVHVKSGQAIENDAVLVEIDPDTG
ncbi:MAG: biotin/lipoyl-containing protein [Candidatus Aminicenantes bacterium]|nr:biotin/lipoyl-containing protein [Candidatus Aminicenantes bacterium]